MKADYLTQKLGRLHRAGELTVIQVPNRTQEAVRDVTRRRSARASVKKILLSMHH